MNGVLIFFMRALEVLFFAGLAGSAIVVAISFVEDIVVLFEPNKPRREPRQADASRHEGAPYRTSSSSAGA
jgi:hypothetical protein